jgi:glycosyltransferase involved in cell wall biosynthesis/predicted metal-dependent phosphoesterase TrpH
MKTTRSEKYSNEWKPRGITNFSYIAHNFMTIITHIWDDMKKIDLHLHSRFSNTSQDAVVRALGSSESYAEPLSVYRVARSRGMDYVTVTDHDTIAGCLLLAETHPRRTIMGVETTTYFPHDKCPVHVLLYGFSEAQFLGIQKLRKDIFELREYIFEQSIAHSVSHPTYRLADELSVEHVEKLILLFNVFEGTNGCRNNRANSSFTKILKGITPNTIAYLEKKHGIKAKGDKPWHKGITAGTDDHSGILAGITFTSIEAESRDEIVEAILKGNTLPQGHSQDHRGYALHLAKIGLDFLANKWGDGNSGKGDLFREFPNHIIFGKKLRIKNTLAIFGIRKLKKLNKPIHDILTDILSLSRMAESEIQLKLTELFRHLTRLSDTLIVSFFKAVSRIAKQGKFSSLFRDLPLFFGGLLMYIPTLFALKYMHKDLSLVKAVEDCFLPASKKKTRKILWFTDTIEDMNGVSTTLCKIGWRAHEKGHELAIVSSAGHAASRFLPPNLINLDSLYTFTLPFYDILTLKIPSFFSMLEKIDAYEPDEIYVSTPGPIGLYGLAYARLFNIRCTVVYHTDFTAILKRITGRNNLLVPLMEKYMKWFHSKFDRIESPTEEYARILESLGHDPGKIGIFNRGIDPVEFYPRKTEGIEHLRTMYGIQSGPTLLYAGRISEDKNIDFLIELFRRLRAKNKNISLVVAGDGPSLKSLIAGHKQTEGLHFAGNVRHDRMTLLYSGADFFVFPSTTDTFGMVVLEAQACGLPAFVSDAGGPQEIVLDGITGSVLPGGDIGIWEERLMESIDLAEKGDPGYFAMCKNARENAIKKYSWNNVLEQIFHSPSPKAAFAEKSARPDAAPIS